MALCETTMSMSLQFTINATLKIPGALVFLTLMVLFKDFISWGFHFKDGVLIICML
jgi:hypothetical protein